MRSEVSCTLIMQWNRFIKHIYNHNDPYSTHTHITHFFYQFTWTSLGLYMYVWIFNSSFNRIGLDWIGERTEGDKLRLMIIVWRVCVCRRYSMFKGLRSIQSGSYVPKHQRYMVYHFILVCLFFITLLVYDHWIAQILCYFQVNVTGLRFHASLRQNHTSALKLKMSMLCDLTTCIFDSISSCFIYAV